MVEVGAIREPRAGGLAADTLPGHQQVLIAIGAQLETRNAIDEVAHDSNHGVFGVGCRRRRQESLGVIDEQLARFAVENTVVIGGQSETRARRTG